MKKNTVEKIIGWPIIGLLVIVYIFGGGETEKLEYMPNILIGDWRATSLIQEENRSLYIRKKDIFIEGRFYEILAIDAQISSDGLAGNYTVTLKNSPATLSFHLDRDGILKAHWFWEAGEDRYGDTRYQYTEKISFSKS